ncbi:UNVERIFIED_ORG: hypothetical protein FHR35_007797 [Microbispora rosea subsp. rosea]
MLPSPARLPGFLDPSTSATAATPYAMVVSGAGRKLPGDE